MISFWKWFFSGSGAGPGFRRFLDVWIFVHIAMGITASLIIPISLEEAGRSLLLPLAGIFIGLSFAWGGNAQALLQTEEIEKLSSFREGGYEEYIYAYQSAVLLILVSLVSWGVAGLGVFDRVWPIDINSCSYHAITGILYFFASITLRECWHVVLGAQALLLIRFKVRKKNG